MTRNIRKYIKVIIFSLLLIISNKLNCFAQTNPNWVSYFSQQDQTELQLLQTKININALKIVEVIGTSNIDSIYTLMNGDTPDIIPHDLFKEKTNTNDKIISIYNNYINSTKNNIELLNEYNLKAQNNIITINERNISLNKVKNKLNTMSDSLDRTKNLIKIIKTQEDIILNSKQYFTLFMLSNNGVLLSNAQNQITNKPTKHYSESLTTVNVLINDEVVESIQISLSNYKEDTNNDLYRITSYDIVNISNTWDRFVYPQADTFDLSNKELEVSTNIDSNTAVFAEIPKENNDNKSNNTLVTKIEDEAGNSTIIKSTQPIINPIDTPQQLNGLIFRVQIAASRTPLELEKLEFIYSGILQIKMFQEEGWYKYYIADCKTLKEAIIIKKESKVSDVFVMAYNNGIKVKYYLKYAKTDQERPPHESYIDIKSLSTDRLVIVIQIAADRKPLSNEKIKEIYTGNKPINYINEDGWHKYSFGNYDRFWPANHDRRNCGIKDAFIVAYKNGSKFNLWPENEKNNLNKK